MNNTPKMPPEELACQNKHQKLVCMTVLMASNATTSYASQFNKKLQHTSRLSGKQWVEEILAGHQRRFYNELRVQKFVFRRLLHVHGQKTGLAGMCMSLWPNNWPPVFTMHVEGYLIAHCKSAFSIVGIQLPSVFCFILGIQYTNLISLQGVSIAYLTC